jgi:nucleolar MIF4G domain-containing protein 1
MINESELESEDEDLQQFYPDSEDDEMDGVNQGEADGQEIKEDEQSLPADSEQEDSQGPSQISRSPERPEQPSTSKYIPPALRKAQQAASLVPEEDPKLRRQLMGLLNRLSPISFPALVFKEGDVGTLNGIYLSHPRAVVSKLLVTLIPEIVSAQGDGIGETQIVVLAALVKAISSGLLGGMSSSGGVEFGAALVDHIIREMDRKDHTHKERSNLIHFLAMLYNMQVIACTLLYDMIKESISNGLSEENVDALVKIVRGNSSRHVID